MSDLQLAFLFPYIPFLSLVIVFAFLGLIDNNNDDGDILVFWGPRPQPIIHRVVKIWQNEDSSYHYQTKGDHNKDSFSGINGELDISEDRVIGQSLFKIPYLGWIKILFVDFLSLFGVNLLS